MSDNAFTERDGTLYADAVPLTALAEQYGTPLYVYSARALDAAYQRYAEALRPDDRVCYAVKANSTRAVLARLAEQGAGFDIVSGGELERVLAAGGTADRVVFSGVGKTRDEMRQALHAGIHCFNVESAAELNALEAVAAEMGCPAPVSLRVNPDVDARTHPYISTGLRDNKFGIPMEQARVLYESAQRSPHLDVRGIDCHIGSQLTEVAPYRDALNRVLALVDTLAEAGIRLAHLDIGGGLGVRYRDEEPPGPDALIRTARECLGDRDLALILEPGRSIAAAAGLLLTRVLYLKDNGDKHFAVVDAGMNDLLRPALYDAWMAIEPVTPRTGAVQRWDIVGPVCETGDFLGQDRALCLEAGDLLAVRMAGAYAFSMSSQYNSRPRPAEVMVAGTRHQTVRPRETVTDLMRGERVFDDGE